MGHEQHAHDHLSSGKGAKAAAGRAPGAATTHPAHAHASAMADYVWVLWLGQDLSFGLARMVGVMVIACPHALGLAIPLVVAVSTSIATKAGILIKNREAFERAREIKVVLFDKTGTLTEGRFALTDAVALDKSLTRDELLKYAASVEQYSEHALAGAIAASASEIYPSEDFRALPGLGARARVRGQEVQVVGPRYLAEKGLVLDDPRPAEWGAQGKTVVFTFIEGRAVGAIALGDVIRSQSRPAVADLESLGIACAMLTGDNESAARHVAEETGIREYFAGALPQQKVEKIREFQRGGRLVAMVGDGINDAPALAQANVGIAIGAGTEVAAAAADIVLVGSDPRETAKIVRLSRGTMRKMRQNLAWATGYNLVAIPLAAGAAFKAGIMLDPALGAALMAASTTIVALNARFFKEL